MLIYFLTVLISFILMFFTVAHSDGRVTVGDIAIITIISLIPFVNFAFGLAAIAYLLLNKVNWGRTIYKLKR